MYFVSSKVPLRMSLSISKNSFPSMSLIIFILTSPERFHSSKLPNPKQVEQKKKIAVTKNIVIFFIADQLRLLKYS